MNSRKICCVVPKCEKYLSHGVIMYKFPTNEVRRRIWTDQVARSNWTPTNDSLICEVHFEESEFEGKRKLRDDAVPTVFHHFESEAVENPLETEGFLLVDTDSSEIKNINEDSHKNETKTSLEHTNELFQQDFKVEVMDEFENTLQETQNFINVKAAAIHNEDSNPPKNISVETRPVNKYVNLNAKRKSTTTKDMYRKELEKVDISIAKKPKRTESSQYGYLSIDELSKKLKEQNGKELPRKIKQYQEKLDLSKKSDIIPEMPLHNDTYESKKVMKVYPKLEEYINISKTHDYNKKNLEDSLTHVGAEIDLASIDQETHELFLEKRDLIKRVQHLEKLNQGLKDMLIAKGENHVAQLERFLNKDQIKHIQKGTKLTKNSSVKWSDETYEKARNLVLYCGWTGYKEILKAKFPFPNIRSLQRVYSGQSWKLRKDYKCEICEKKGRKREFFKKENLQLHIRRAHDGIKDHQCTFCGMMFGTPQILRNHVYR